MRHTVEEHRKNLMVLGLSAFVIWASWGMFIPFLPVLLADMGVTRGLEMWTGIIIAASSVPAIFAQPFWGMMGDRKGNKPMLIRAGICMTLVFIGMSVSTAPWHLVLCRLVHGAFSGFGASATSMVSSNTPRREAPGAVAAMQAFMASGTLAGPAIGGLLFAVTGYRISLLMGGLGILLCTLLVAFMTSEKEKPVPAEDSGFLSPFKAAAGSSMLKFVLLIALMVSMTGSMISPILTLYLHSLDKGMPLWLVGIIYSLPGLAIILTASLWTRIGGRYGYEKTIFTAMACTILGLMALPVMGRVIPFAALYFVVGCFLAALSALSGAIICTRVSEELRSSAYGLQTGAVFFGALVAPLLSGWIGGRWGLGYPFFIAALLLLLGGSHAVSLYMRGDTSVRDYESIEAE